MSRDDVRACLREILGEIAPDTDLDALEGSADLREALDLDSMDFLAFVRAIHARLGVAVPERDYTALRTLDAATEHLTARAP
jgi:acyl carrier protein